MTRYFPPLKTRIVLRLVIFGAGVLAVLLTCAGTAAGVTWVADDDDDDDGGAGVGRQIVVVVA